MLTQSLSPKFSPLYKFCDAPGSLYHMIWECSANPKIARIPHPSREQREKELSSSGPDSCSFGWWKGPLQQESPMES